MSDSIFIKQFEDISIRGRIAYGTMCAEEYILSTRPTQDWSPVFKKIWDFNEAEYWDDWHDEMLDILPECFLEFPSYETSDFQVLTKEEYAAINALYQPIPEHWEAIIKNIFAMEEAYAYSTIPGTGLESLQSLSAIIDVLEGLHITLPSLNSVQQYRFAEKKGWGERFDCKPLSKILK